VSLLNQPCLPTNYTATDICPQPQVPVTSSRSCSTFCLRILECLSKELLSHVPQFTFRPARDIHVVQWKVLFSKVLLSFSLFFFRRFLSPFIPRVRACATPPPPRSRFRNFSSVFLFHAANLWRNRWRSTSAIFPLQSRVLLVLQTGAGQNGTSQTERQLHYIRSLTSSLFLTRTDDFVLVSAKHRNARHIGQTRR